MLHINSEWNSAEIMSVSLQYEQFGNQDQGNNDKNRKG